jgi:hypothetical protein
MRVLYAWARQRRCGIEPYEDEVGRSLVDFGSKLQKSDGTRVMISGLLDSNSPEWLTVFNPPAKKRNVKHTIIDNDVINALR